MLLLPDAMGHEGFTTDGLIQGRSAIAGYWPAGTASGAEGHRTVRRYVHNFFAAVLAQNAESRAFLSKPPAESSPGSRVTFERRPAAPPTVTYDEFVQAVIGGRADEAIARLRAAAAVEPNHPLLKEDSLFRLNFSLLYTWGLTREVRPVIEFMIERFPGSSAAREMLGALESQQSR